MIVSPKKFFLLAGACFFSLFFFFSLSAPAIAQGDTDVDCDIRIRELMLIPRGFDRVSTAEELKNACESDESCRMKSWPNSNCVQRSKRQNQQTEAACNALLLNSSANCRDFSQLEGQCQNICENNNQNLHCEYYGRATCGQESEVRDAERRRLESTSKLTTKEECDYIVESGIHPDCLGLEGEREQECLESVYNSCIELCTNCRAPVTGSVRTKPDGYQGPLPDCAFTDQGCDDVKDVLQLVVNASTGIFPIIGSFALVFFVYGGIVIVLSAGNPERVKKGRDIIMAAIIGMIISFGAYLLIGFVLDALQVQPEFRAIN